MGRQQQNHRSFRSKAVHFVSDFANGFLIEPASDKPAKLPEQQQQHPHPPPEHESESETSELGSTAKEEDSTDEAVGPDTSSFTAFLSSLLSVAGSENNTNLDEQEVSREDISASASEPTLKGSIGKKGLLSRGKKTLGRAIYQAARLGGYRGSDDKGSSDSAVYGGNGTKVSEDEGIAMQTLKRNVSLDNLPETSEPSLLLSEKTRSYLYSSLPALVQGRKWVLLYSTWRHGISLGTLYRRSMFWPGLSLLVVGDRKGTVFGGLVEAPLSPTNQRKYQGTNNTFVFTNTPGHPVIYRPTGINRYFTLCSTEFLALGGGSHFALYLDGDLLNGSSGASETFGNTCLSKTEDFEVKEIELWAFVYATKYEELVSLLRAEAPGIARW